MEYKINQKSLYQNITKPSLNISSLSKINKKEELNSTISNIKPISHIDNNSLNQINPSTPVSSFQMYEADSSPTNYIKSNSNINSNNLTFLTNNNNNSKKNGKNYIKFIKIAKDQSEGYSIHSDLNQSDFTYTNTNISNNKGIYGQNINLNSIKEEEKRITEKLEKNHKLRKNKNNNLETDEINATQNTIEEKDEEYEIIEKINSILNTEKKPKNKNADYPQQSLDTIFQESELLSDTKKILDKRSNRYIKFVNNKTGNEKKKINEEEKQLELDLENENEKEEKEIMERIEKLRKEKEKKEKFDLEEKKLRKKLEEEKRKKRLEEERIKNLKMEEEEKMKKILEKEDEKIKIVKKEGELKKKELEKIKEELKKEEQQRKSLEKKADLLEIKIRNKKLGEKYKTDNMINDSIGIDFKSTYSHTNTKLYYDYSSIPNSVENINKGDLNNKNNTDVNKTYIYNKINSAKSNKKYISDRLNSSCYNYSYGTTPNIDKEIYNSHLITRNDDNSIINNNYKSNDEEKQYESSKIDDFPPKNKEKKIIYNNSFCRSNSLTQFRMEIISDNKMKNHNKNYSFSSFNFKINNNKDSFQNKINKYFKELNENSEEINNVNSDRNDNLVSKILKERNNRTSTKDVSTQYQEYYYNKENMNDTNNLFFRTQKYSTGTNTEKPEIKRSFSNYSKITIPKKISHETTNNDNNNSIFFDPKNNTLFEYNQFRSNYEKLKSCKRLNSTNYYIDNLFRRNSLKKKSNNEDELYKKKSYVNIFDNKRNTYDKIPHHLKTDKNEGGLWSDFSLSGNKTRGLTDQSSSIYSNGSYMSNKNKNKFNRKINTSVLPANPFDSVNEAREYFFFHD